MNIIMITGSILVPGIIIGVVSFIGGGLVSYVIYQTLLRRKRFNILNEAELEAEVIKKEKILQAKEKFYQLKTEHEKHINERNQKVVQAENKLKQRESALSQKLAETQRTKQEVETIRTNLDSQLELVEKKNEELERLHKQQVEKL